MAEPARQIAEEPGRPQLAAVTAEAPSRPVETPPTAPRAEPPPEKKRKRRRSLRGPLLLLGPIVVLAGAVWFYLNNGGYVGTDDAYVKADIVNIADDVSGIVASVDVKPGQVVHKGDLLFSLDDEPYRIALEGAQAQLGVVVNQLDAAKATYHQARAQVAQAEADLTYYTKNKQRQSDLASRNVASKAALDQAERDYRSAQSRLLAARNQADAALAQLGGKPDLPVEQYAHYKQAMAAVDKATRDLRRTRVYARTNGVVANVSQLQPGNYLMAAQTAFNLVSLDNMWVDANLKETELNHVTVGDRATIAVDAYNGRVWKAHVAAIAPATGAEFSVLPAQNSSGNWVKVVQRLTVRLAIEPEPGAPQLRAGMSVYASIDTGAKRSLATLWRAITRTIGL